MAQLGINIAQADPAMQAKVLGQLVGPQKAHTLNINPETGEYIDGFNPITNYKNGKKVQSDIDTMVNITDLHLYDTIGNISRRSMPFLNYQSIPGFLGLRGDHQGHSEHYGTRSPFPCIGPGNSWNHTISYMNNQYCTRLLATASEPCTDPELEGHSAAWLKVDPECITNKAWLKSHKDGDDVTVGSGIADGFVFVRENTGGSEQAVAVCQEICTVDGEKTIRVKFVCWGQEDFKFDEWGGCKVFLLHGLTTDGGCYIPWCVHSTHFTYCNTMTKARYKYPFDFEDTFKCYFNVPFTDSEGNAYTTRVGEGVAGLKDLLRHAQCATLMWSTMNCKDLTHKKILNKFGCECDGPSPDAKIHQTMGLYQQAKVLGTCWDGINLNSVPLKPLLEFYTKHLENCRIMGGNVAWFANRNMIQRLTKGLMEKMPVELWNEFFPTVMSANPGCGTIVKGLYDGLFNFIQCGPYNIQFVGVKEFEMDTFGQTNSFVITPIGAHVDGGYSKANCAAERTYGRKIMAQDGATPYLQMKYLAKGGIMGHKSDYTFLTGPEGAGALDAAYGGNVSKHVTHECNTICVVVSDTNMMCVGDPFSLVAGTFDC